MTALLIVSALFSAASLIVSVATLIYFVKNIY